MNRVNYIESQIDNNINSISRENLKKDFENLVIDIKLGRQTFNLILKECKNINPECENKDLFELVNWYIKNGKNEFLKEKIKSILFLKEKEEKILNGYDKLYNTLVNFFSSKKISNFNTLVDSLERDPDISELISFLDSGYKNNTKTFWELVRNGKLDSRFAEWAKTYFSFDKLRAIFFDLQQIGLTISEQKEKLLELKENINTVRASLEKIFGEINIPSSFEVREDINYDFVMQGLEFFKQEAILKLMIKIKNFISSNENLTDKDLKNFVNENISLQDLSFLNEQVIDYLIITLDFLYKYQIISDKGLITKFIKALLFIKSSLKNVQFVNGELNLIKRSEGISKQSFPDSLKTDSVVSVNSDLLANRIVFSYLPEKLKEKISNNKKIGFLLNMVAVLLDKNTLDGEKIFNSLKRYIETDPDYEKLKSQMDKITKNFFEKIVEPILKESKNSNEFEKKFEEKMKIIVGGINLSQLYLDWLKIVDPNEYSSNKIVRKLESKLIDGDIFDLLNFWKRNYNTLPHVNEAKFRSADFGETIMEILQKEKYLDIDDNDLFYIVINNKEYFKRFFGNQSIYEKIYLDVFEGLKDELLDGSSNKISIYKQGIYSKLLDIYANRLKDSQLSENDLEKYGFSIETNNFKAKEMKDFEKIKDFLINKINNIQFKERLLLFYPTIRLNGKKSIEEYKSHFLQKFIFYLEILYIAKKENKVVDYSVFNEIRNLSYILFGTDNLGEVLNLMKSNGQKNLIKIISNFNTLNLKDINKGIFDKIKSIIFGKEGVDPSNIDNQLEEIFDKEDELKQFNKYLNEFWHNSPLYLKQLICQQSGLNSCTNLDNNINTYPEIKAFLIKRILFNSYFQAKAIEDQANWINGLKGNKYVILKSIAKKFKPSTADYIKSFAINLSRDLAYIVATGAIIEIIALLSAPLTAGASEVIGNSLLATRLTKIGGWVIRGGRWILSADRKAILLRDSIKVGIGEPLIYAKLTGQDFMEVAPYWWIGLGGSFVGGRLFGKILPGGAESSSTLLKYMYASLGGVGVMAFYDYLRGDFDISSLPQQFIFMLMLYAVERGRIKVESKWLSGRKTSLTEGARGWASDKRLGGWEDYKAGIIFIGNKVKGGYEGLRDWYEERKSIKEGIKILEKYKKVVNTHHNISEGLRQLTDREKNLLKNLNEKYNLGQYFDNPDRAISILKNLYSINSLRKILGNKLIESALLTNRGEGLKNSLEITRKAIPIRDFEINISGRDYRVKEVCFVDVPKDSRIFRFKKEPILVLEDGSLAIRRGSNYELINGLKLNNNEILLSLNDKFAFVYNPKEIYLKIYRRGGERYSEEGTLNKEDIFTKDGKLDIDKLEEIDKYLSREFGPDWDRYVIGDKILERCRKVEKSFFAYLKEKGEIIQSLESKVIDKYEELKKLDPKTVKKYEPYKSIYNKFKEFWKRRGKSNQEAERLAVKSAKDVILKTLGLVYGFIKFPFKMLKWGTILGIIGIGGLYYDRHGDHELDTYNWLKQHFPELMDSATTGGLTIIGTYGIGWVLEKIGLKTLGEFFRKNGVKIGIGAAGIKLFFDLGGYEKAIELFGKLRSEGK